MPKQYKHKKLWWIAKERIDDGTYSVYVIYDELEKPKLDWISKELIEDSNDRELIKEKDWINKIVDDFVESRRKDNDGKSYRYIRFEVESLKRNIEKYIPKITEEELDSIINKGLNYYEWNEMVFWYQIRDMLKEKWLYKE